MNRADQIASILILMVSLVALFLVNQTPICQGAITFFAGPRAFVTRLFYEVKLLTPSFPARGFPRAGRSEAAKRSRDCQPDLRPPAPCRAA
jgi:hypothetical protein